MFYAEVTIRDAHFTSSFENHAHKTVNQLIDINWYG